LGRAGVTWSRATRAQLSEPIALVADAQPLGVTTAVVTVAAGRLRLVAAAGDHRRDDRPTSAADADHRRDDRPLSAPAAARRSRFIRDDRPLSAPAAHRDGFNPLTEEARP
jgi:hypothetical protein